MVGPEDITWRVRPDPMRVFEDIRRRVGLELYNTNKQALRRLLCDYFNAVKCNGSTKTIAPIGCTSRGGKLLKVRLALPGEGKSGGLRLCVVAYCRSRSVSIAAAVSRRHDPALDELMASGEEADDDL